MLTSGLVPPNENFAVKSQITKKWIDMYFLLRVFVGLVVVASSQTAYGGVISGSTSAVFVDPNPFASFYTGVGTNNFTFGDPAGFGTGPSLLVFDGVSFDTTTESDFLIGTLFFFNGTVLGPVPSTVNLSLQLDFSNPPVGLITSDFTLNLVLTPNIGDPDADADAVIFPNTFSSTFFSIDGVDYTLQPLGFRNVIGDGFITSDDQRLNARESASASAELYGRVTANFPGAVPEPSSAIALGLLTLLACAASRRRFTRLVKP